MIWIVAAVGLLLSLLPAYVAANLAAGRGRSGMGGALVGLFGGWFGVGIILLLSDESGARDRPEPSSPTSPPRRVRGMRHCVNGGCDRRFVPVAPDAGTTCESCGSITQPITQAY